RGLVGQSRNETRRERRDVGRWNINFESVFAVLKMNGHKIKTFIDEQIDSHSYISRASCCMRKSNSQRALLLLSQRSRLKAVSYVAHWYSVCSSDSARSESFTSTPKQCSGITSRSFPHRKPATCTTGIVVMDSRVTNESPGSIPPSSAPSPLAASSGSSPVSPPPAMNCQSPPVWRFLLKT